jgi:chromatin assembly factor 1 subunit B
MKANPLIINWHESNSPIYSADFQKGDKGRLATGAGDNNVRVRPPLLSERLPWLVH